MAIHDDLNSVTLPIPSNAVAYATKISVLYDDDTIRHRVFYNAIAVVILHNFFEILGVQTHFEDSDLSSPPLQLAADSSTLTYENLGCLECRGLPHEETSFQVPFETWSDRLGYVFVGIDANSRTAKIHGFVRQVTTQNINIDALQTVEAMVQTLHLLAEEHQGIARTCLSPWLEGIFQPGWETLDSILRHRPKQSGLAFRGLAGVTLEGASSNQTVTDGEMASRAKVLHWQPQAGIAPSQLNDTRNPEPVVLVVEIYQHDPVIAHVLIQMHPFHTAQCLPPGLTLTILDAQQKSILTATSRPIDNYLHFPFKGKAGEEFQVNVRLDQFVINEYFQI